MLRSPLCILATILIAASEPTGVEVRTDGNDELAQRLADQARATFAAASGYTAEASAKRLIITIPTHVQWRASTVTPKSPIASKKHPPLRLLLGGRHESLR